MHASVRNLGLALVIFWSLAFAGALQLAEIERSTGTLAEVTMARK